MTNKQKCEQIAHAMGVSVSLSREGRRITVEAVTPCRQMFECTGSHTLVSSEFQGFEGGADRCWADMAERLASESLVPCPPECDCWDDCECQHG